MMMLIPWVTGHVMKHSAKHLDWGGQECLKQFVKLVDAKEHSISIGKFGIVTDMMVGVHLVL